ncbi:ribosome modulation factor [Flocculibacter collagenilyticus]|uniref:ribosome modulation factor n=1 Tax=Flocculibacter collagenilyticus TaxID=2744479 RepID=UPI0018F52E1D|nr:ribosome modulation factor [Flocculibacter collagenilyticus]
MKRQKRDRSERAHSQGYKAGLSGKHKDACPYQNLETRMNWLGGWREANQDRSLGLFK